MEHSVTATKAWRHMLTLSMCREVGGLSRTGCMEIQSKLQPLAIYTSPENCTLTRIVNVINQPHVCHNNTYTVTVWCRHTNYLCAETGIVAWLSGALWGGSPSFWKAQLLAFQERSVPSTWQWRFHFLSSLSFFPPLHFSWHFQTTGSTLPRDGSVQHSWLTFNSKARVKREPRSIKWNWPQGCTLATP